MSKFDWQTDGDDLWTDGDRPKAPRSVWRLGRTLWRMLLAGALFSVVAVLLYRRVDERVEAATAAVREELLSSHHLLFFAVTNGDDELFDSLLSGRDMAWTNAQRELFAGRLFIDHEPLGFHTTLKQFPSVDEVADNVDASVEFSSDLTSAVVTTSQQFYVLNSKGTTETVKLTRTDVYRKGQSRWLLAPPEAGFWGSRQRYLTPRLTLDYPERDQEVVEKLGLDLDHLVRRLCQTFANLGCTDEQRVTVRLETDPWSLVTAADYLSSYQGDLRITLPTVTLIGLPEDEQAYASILRAYASRILPAVVAHQVGWSCCAQAAYFQALLEYEMSQLGVFHWPIGVEQHERVASEDVDLQDVAQMWLNRDLDRLMGDEGWKVYTFIDFLIGEFPRISPAAMQRELSDHNTLNGWLSSLDPSIGGLESPETPLEIVFNRWQVHSYLLVASMQPEAPIELPEEDLMVSCLSSQLGPAPVLLRFQPKTERWTELGSFPESSLYVALAPVDDTLIVSGVVVNESGEEQWQMYLWRDNRTVPLFTDGVPRLTLGQLDPTGRYLLVYLIDQTQELPIAQLLDMEQCLSEQSCIAHSIFGPPTWSPDGAHMLLTASESLGSNPIVVGQRAFLTSPAPQALWSIFRTGSVAEFLENQDAFSYVGTGSAPFWMNENEYGYVRGVPTSSVSGDHEIVIASVEHDAPRVVLDLSSIKGALQPMTQGANLAIAYVTPNPQQASEIIVVVLEQGVERFHVLAADLEREEIRLLISSKSQFNTTVGFSPDGRWLTLTGAGQSERRDGEPEGVLYLYDLLLGDTEQYGLGLEGYFLGPPYAWSPDSQWLVAPASSLALNLIAPGHDYVRPLVHGQRECGALVWIGS